MRTLELRSRFLEEPYVKTLGAQLKTCVDGSVLLLVPSIARRLCVASGIAQGGVIASLADYAAVYAAMSAISEGFTPCKSISINFLRPVMEGESILVRAEVVNQNRSELLVHSTVFSAMSYEKKKAIAFLTFAKPKSNSSR